MFTSFCDAFMLCCYFLLTRKSVLYNRKACIINFYIWSTPYSYEPYCMRAKFIVRLDCRSSKSNQPLGSYQTGPSKQPHERAQGHTGVWSVSMLAETPLVWFLYGIAYFSYINFWQTCPYHTGNWLLGWCKTRQIVFLQFYHSTVV